MNKDISTSAENKTVNYQEGQLSNILAPAGPVAETIPAKRKENTESLAEGQAKDKHVVEAEKNSSAENSTILTKTKENGKKNLGEKNSKLEKESVDRRSSADSANLSSSERIKADENSTMLEQNQACNYAKGKWVVDDSRPLYSGAHCKQWLSQMWACRLMQRTDFAYERLRWQPKDCQMEEFEGSQFLT
ncbi:hypothetical protein CISIN_1g0096291mg, partial [Citrus sinensis]